VSTEDKINQLWYTRRADVIRGPFPAGMIRRHILLGRIIGTDQLTQDKVNWSLVSELSHLIPEEMKAELSLPENKERFMISFNREDERRFDDRRQLSRESSEYTHQGNIERRVVEHEATIRHREIKTAFSDSIKKSNKNNVSIRMIGLVVIMLLVIILSLNIPPQLSIAQAEIKCHSDPRPNLNWNNCGKEGINLSGLSLAGSKLRGVRFVGANLAEVNLIAADMSYANFANAYAATAKLQRSTLVGSVLRNADFSGADFSNADLSFAILNGTDLSDANFSGAILNHVVLNDAILTNTNFKGAILDKAIWSDNSVCAPESVGRCIIFKKN